MLVDSSLVLYLKQALASNKSPAVELRGFFFWMYLPPQMDRSVSVSVGVVFGLTLPTLSSGIEEGSPFRPGRTPKNIHTRV